MAAVKDLIRNIILIALICFGLYLLFPNTIQRIHNYFGSLFEPLLIIIFVLIALPWRSGKE